MSQGTIYILEFSQPLGNEKHRANYYIGWCSEGRLLDRFQEHCAGCGAAITRAVIERGYKLKILYTMTGTRDDERKLKRQKNTPRLVRHLRKKGLIPMEQAA